jgi:hypothetical protein
LKDIREGRDKVDIKEKKPVCELKNIQAKKQQSVKPSDWKPPDTGWQCLNVHASYIQYTGEASWGGVIEIIKDR